MDNNSALKNGLQDRQQLGHHFPKERQCKLPEAFGDVQTKMQVCKATWPNSGKERFPRNKINELEVSVCQILKCNDPWYL